MACIGGASATLLTWTIPDHAVLENLEAIYAPPFGLRSHAHDPRL